MHKIKPVWVHKIINKKSVTVNSKENSFCLDAFPALLWSIISSVSPLCQPHLKISRQGMRHPVHLLTSTVPLWVWESINMWFGFFVHFQPFHTIGINFSQECSSQKLLDAQWTFTASYVFPTAGSETLCISDTQKCLWGLSLVSSKCDDLHFSFI